MHDGRCTKSNTFLPRCPCIHLPQYHNPKPSMTPRLPYPEYNKTITKNIRKNLGQVGSSNYFLHSNCWLQCLLFSTITCWGQRCRRLQSYYWVARVRVQVQLTLPVDKCSLRLSSRKVWNFPHEDLLRHHRFIYQTFPAQMATPTTATGGCFCGNVRIEYSGQPMTSVGLSPAPTNCVSSLWLT